MNMKNLWTILVALIFFTANGQSEVPKFTLESVDGNFVDLQDISRDKTVVISLWATWCVPCINELEAIDLVYEDWQEDFGMELYAVSIDDPRTVNRVMPMVKGKGWNYKVLLDTNNDLRRALGAATVPLTLLVKDNKILYKHSGYSPGSEDILYQKLMEHSRK